MRKACIIILLILSLVLTVSCSKSGSGDVIKIGVNYELSGGVATYGQSSVEGIELAIEQINEAGGVKGKKD